MRLLWAQAKEIFELGSHLNLKPTLTMDFFECELKSLSWESEIGLNLTSARRDDMQMYSQTKQGHVKHESFFYIERYFKEFK